MKKSLVLAMAMALGVTASAYAANPFSDVPAGHWAYDSVNKLAAAGVIDGYGDGSFGGDKLMTRYEMAQIVARAMANGANVDKLAAEFADELDALGVRVAALEKKADNVKITGQIRYHYSDLSGDIDGSASKLRSRIWINGQINDNWGYKGMLENIQDFRNNAGDETTNFQRAYVEGRIGGVAVSAGRQELFLVDGNLYDTRADFIQASYGKDVKLTAFGGKPTNQKKTLVGVDKDWKDEADYGEVYGANVSGKIGVVKANVGYTIFKDGVVNSYNYDKAEKEWGKPVASDADDNKVWNVGVGFDVAKDVSLTADYMKSSIDKYAGSDIDDDAIIIGLNILGAKAAKPGSFGVYAKYYDQGRGTVVAHTMNGENGTALNNTGFKGYMVGANYTFAKNIVGTVEYYDLKTKELGDNDKLRTLWSQLIFTF